MSLFLLGLGLIALGGILSLIPRVPRVLASAVCNGLMILGCAVGVVPAIQVLAGGPLPSLNMPWSVPAGQIELLIDPLSALFLLLHFIVCGSAVMFGIPYFSSYEKTQSLKPVRFFTSILIISIALTFTAQNTILFLGAWELMALSTFFLVIFEDRQERVRKAGFLYLIMSHTGTLCLFVVFLLLGRQAGSLGFSQMAHNKDLLAVGTPIFLLALVGFGVKAGFMPIHFWLQEAHPAAPTPVSAIMSGVVIKCGIYGLVRVISFFPTLPAWWGIVLIMIGTTSGILGVVWALAQHDFKRLLAYHSIENIGIIVLGLGFGCLGLSLNNPVVAMLGLAGGLWHTLNHGLFKSLLFLGAGSIYHATGSREIDQMGGLWKKMPWTGFCFLVGSVAICGIPPLNGFVSEWLIYNASFVLGIHNSNFCFVLGVPVLALIGVLAAACFTKVFGVLFLGNARTEAAVEAQEGGALMLIPMLFLASLCFAIGLFPGVFLPAMSRVITVFSSVEAGEFHQVAMNQAGMLAWIGWLSVGILAVIGVLALVRRLFLVGKPVSASATWGCGYALPSPRMQYTASSYAQFSTLMFRAVLRPLVHMKRITSLFPAAGSFESHSPDAVLDRFIPRLAAILRRVLYRVRDFQHGRVQFYLAYVLLFLILLLVWEFHGVSLLWKKIFLLDAVTKVPPP